MTGPAAEAMARAREILAFKHEPERVWWNGRLTPEDQRRALVKIGAEASFAGFAWDSLPYHYQDGLRLLYRKSQAAYERLRRQFDGLLPGVGS